MDDLHRYESTYWVHTTSEDFASGDSYNDLDDALADAKDMAAQNACDMEITHVLERVLKRVRVRVEIEDI